MKQTDPATTLEGELLTPCAHCYGFVEDHARDGYPDGDCRRAASAAPVDPSERLGELAQRMIRTAAARTRSPLGVVALAIGGGLVAGVRAARSEEARAAAAKAPRRRPLRRAPKSRRP